MKIKVIVSCLWVFTIAQADLYPQGISFIPGLNWQQIVDKARAENKFIFVDFFATWCSPCRSMKREIFSQQTVGDYFRQHFISVEIQTDSTVFDDENIRQSYGLARMLVHQYNIYAYPTYLFFDSGGKLIHRIEGAVSPSANWIKRASDALKPATQYYTLLNDLPIHNTDSNYLLQAWEACVTAEDFINAGKISEKYMLIAKNPYRDRVLRLLPRLVKSSRQQGFKIIANNGAKVDFIEGKGFAENICGPVIFNEDVKPLFSKTGTPLQWKKIVMRLRAKYPGLWDIAAYIKPDYEDSITKKFRRFAGNQTQPIRNWENLAKKFEQYFVREDFDQIYLEQKASYYASKNDWPNCLQATYVLLKKYGAIMESRSLDNVAWDYVFLHSDDQKIIWEAIRWMKKAVDENPEQSNNIDTYANLLYKAGKKEEAMKWEQKAIEAGNKNNGDLEDRKTFSDNMEKMKRGEPTWDNKG